jgi:hypothetical protein
MPGNSRCTPEGAGPTDPDLDTARSAVAAPMTAEGLYPDADWLHISPLTGCAGLRLAGEADMHTAELVRKAIAELPPDASEIHLQLADLEFIDVSAARQLAVLSERPARPTVILHRPPRSLILLIRLLWPNSRFQICRECAVSKHHVVQLNARQPS